MASLEDYKSAKDAVPAMMLRWHLYGAGLENLGKEGQPEEVSVPAYGDDELLVRQDACGLCFSDTKVIGLGVNHPRMTGRDLANDPVTLGHEVSCTVVGVGKNVKSRFEVGDRFVVQADVFYKGKSMAYGYAISGGLSEYSVIPQAVIDGDEGCYLLPIRPQTGYVESALTEPWACVVSAYAQQHRDGIKNGGVLLVIGGKGSENTEYKLDELFASDRKPGRILYSNVSGKLHSGLESVGKTVGLPAVELVENTDLLETTLAGAKLDDVLAFGRVTPEDIERTARHLADHAILNLVAIDEFSRKLSIDIGRIHYNWHYYLGTSSNNPSESYHEPRNADLLAGGNAWFIGAGGPMGQMHVQRAVQHRNPPKRIVATDVDTVRLQSVADRFGKMANERGIELVVINPKELSPETFNERLRDLGDGHGFDDIVSMVPVAGLIEHAADFLADGAWFNIFAGVARGTMATLDLTAVVSRGARFLGSSGSSLSDMRETLARVEADELSTNASLAAIGGMRAAKEGLRAVKEGWFPGKTLIFPHIHDLPLTPLAELKFRLPSVYAKLDNGQFWTEQAEEELLLLLVSGDLLKAFEVTKEGAARDEAS